ncbi:MAG: site-specific DNA-methyltransferase [Candidatus Taylorbacteria bacterium]|nr:site-specific DNA-methyltransferase [Candidatus Taylorbacteria bacterium]
MADKKQKLELTWIGKGDEPRLEPRILIENPAKSYGDPKSENMLIHGDNLLALKALEQDFAGKIKCIYIDPPYNTGSAFDNYDDNLEHSIWLNLLKPRLEILKKLLSEDGSIYISIDNNEMAYLQVLMDEVFHRKNKKNIIAVKRGSVTGAKVINPGLVNISEFILVYTKNTDKWNPNRLSRKKERDVRYGTFIQNYEENHRNWRFIPLLLAFSNAMGVKQTQLKKNLGGEYETILDKFVLDNAERVVQFASLDEKSISKQALLLKRESLSNSGVTYLLERDGKKPYYIYNGKLIIFVKDRLSQIDGTLSFSEPLTDIWEDVLPNDLHNEGGVEFRKGKKPEKLIQRIFMLASAEGDIVLDSFLGSGTAAAVAQKMKRRWIGIELGEHANTHCVPRLTSVVDGSDQSGISKSVEWRGGGGFKFYNLAPSLLKKDKHDNWVIDTKYNANMLAAAMSKQEGFHFSPDEQVFWKQARSTEKDFLFTTTQFVTTEMLDTIHDEMQPEESLLIACKAFHDDCEGKYLNITIKKIPQILLGRCEFGKDDYSLNIVNIPDEDIDDVHEEPVAVATRKKVSPKSSKKK